MKFNLPVILLKGLVLLPYQEVRLELSNIVSKKVISISSIYHDNRVLIVCPTDEYEESPDVSDLPTIGVVGKVKSIIELPNGNLRIVIVGEKRVNIVEYVNYSNEEDVLESLACDIKEDKLTSVVETSLLRKLMSTLAKYIKSTPLLSNSIMSSLTGETDLSRLTDLITSFALFETNKKLEYMEEISVLKRAEKLIYDLRIEIEISTLDKKIESNLQEELEQSQKKYIIKEKIDLLKSELKDDDDETNDGKEFENKIKSLKIKAKSKTKFLEEVKKYQKTSLTSPESAVIRTYLDWVTNLPWDKLSKDEIDINKIMNSLNQSHFGLDDIKERVIEYIAVKTINKKINSPIICLVGPPGVGKTTLASSIAKSLNKSFYKISVGGLNDSAELLGHRRTYLGAIPGKIIQGLRKCGSSNPVILIDEVDKMVIDYKGDPASALLDVLDPNQNSAFIDNYIEEPVDLSKVMFILTANNVNDIPYLLKDRLEIIKLNTYTDDEKKEIARHYLLPNIYENHLLKEKELVISDAILLYIVNSYTQEAGVRQLERLLSRLIRKIVTRSIIEKTKIKKNILMEDVKNYLGRPINTNELELNKEIGLVNLMANTTFGGQIIQLEVCKTIEKNNLITGKVGEITKDSIAVALTYLRNQENIRINQSFHFHFLESTTLKDGGSAGMAITTAILSCLKNQLIPSDVAFSGEITLNGKIKKVNSIKEKLIAAFNNDIKTVFLPYANQNDLMNVPQEVLKSLKIIFIKNYEELKTILFPD